jgi:Rrf2 family transcriptional regulator, iron-sulfur cluster assembly transcription factor
MTPYGKTSQSAIAAMSRLAQAYGEKCLLSSADIARDRKLPQTLVAKLLTMLSQAGLVIGARGPGGGYRLARAPGRITLLEIVTVFERLDGRTVCPFGPDWCGSNEPCPLHDAYVQFSERFDSFLRQTKLDVFCPKPPSARKKGKSKRSAVQPIG